MNPLPAPYSKHLPIIHHGLPRESAIAFSLDQLSSTDDRPNDSISDGVQSTSTSTATLSTGSTGTTLWLGAQVLSCYMACYPPRLSSIRTASTSKSNTNFKTNKPNKLPGLPRIIELGAGVGYLSLCMARWGYHVLATDVEPVLTRVLIPNIQRGMGVLSRVPGECGTVDVVKLDWEEANQRNEGEEREMNKWLDQIGMVDVIITSDTIYHPSLVYPLFKTIQSISMYNVDHQGRPPPVILALERRDGMMVDTAIQIAENLNVDVKRVGHGRVVKSVEKSGWNWDESDWQGVEIWKGRWKGDSTAQDVELDDEVDALTHS